MNRAGGIFYHYLALKYRRKLWSDFRRFVKAFLEEWNPSESQILLVGPSAGYTLPPEFFSRFETVLGVEPDGLARLLLPRRLGKPVTWIEGSFFSSKLDFSQTERLWKDYPNTAILFCNFLGQLACIYELKDDFSDWKVRVRTALAGAPFSWASYHDRWTSNLKPKLEGWSGIETAFPGEAQVEVFDHRTDGLLPGEGSASRTVWELYPGSFHMIEALSHSNG